jgi:DNA polymerase (family 10)
MTKQEIAGILTEIGILLDLQGANPFRVRAYANAARTIETFQDDLTTLVKEERLTDIKGIGDDLAAKITELITTGQLAYHAELKASFPPGLLELLRIPGSKKTKAVYDKLGVDSIEKLEAACQAGQVAALDGFGEKSQQKILEGITLVRQFSGRHHYHTARGVADPILEALRAHDGVIRCSLAGSLRRHRETIGDVDFLVSAKPKDAAGIIEDFTAMPGSKAACKPTCAW